MDKLPEGQKVLSGIFEFYDSKGIPLSDIFDHLKSKDLVPCWVSFVRSSKTSGWKKRTLISRLKEAIVDSYGLNFWNEIQEKLKIVIDNEFG